MTLSAFLCRGLLLGALLMIGCGEPCQEQPCEANGSCQEYNQLLCSCCPSSDEVAACESAISNGCQNGTLRVCMDEASCSAEIDKWNAAYDQGIEPCASADVSEVASFCEQATSQ